MNLYFRLLWTILTARFRQRTSFMDEHVSTHRVWPGDLDLLGHMNNGRYFTITDFVRVGWSIQAGQPKALRELGVHPVLVGETAQFRRELRLFERFQIKSHVLGWDEKFAYIEHKYESNAGIHAILIVKVYFTGKNRVKPADVMRQAGVEVKDVQSHPIIESWNLSSENHWQERRKAMNPNQQQRA